MAVIIQGVSLPFGVPEEEIISSGLKKAGISRKSVTRTGLHKTSLDARRQNGIKTVSSVWAELESAEEEEKICRLKSFCVYVGAPDFVLPTASAKAEGKRIAVAGFGPAGMLAALILAEAGLRPVVFERGSEVDKRAAAVEDFWKNGNFSPRTNVQFGGGGPGTFSDGK
ncbi:MAG: hypothetical protein NC120_12480, partial [Ruminococcus sp.]|nr:hypothetical protein [Ruminococcus sp.]